MSWQRPNIGSRMNREVHVRFWERPGVKVLRATRHLWARLNPVASPEACTLTLKADAEVAASDVGYGPRLCENAKTLNRDRTSYSFECVLGAHIASPFNFEIELENIILVALRVFEFSHRLGPKAT